MYSRRAVWVRRRTRSYRKNGCGCYIHGGVQVVGRPFYTWEGPLWNSWPQGLFWCTASQLVSSFPVLEVSRDISHDGALVFPAAEGDVFLVRRLLRDLVDVKGPADVYLRNVWKFSNLT